MVSTFFGLNIGKSGLYTYQTALNTTSHNISNAETDGYTRQTVTQKAGTAIRVNSSYGMVGSGVDATGITNSRSAYYDLKYRSNSAILGEYNAKTYYMTEIENYFNASATDVFTDSLDNLADSLQDLSTNPSNLTERTQVVNYAKSMTEYFNSLNTSLESIQKDCNTEVKNAVDKINSYADQIAALTKQINTLEAQGGTANDLRDQRELLVDELSEIANVKVTENVVGTGETGITSYVVDINGQTLVDTYNVNKLKVVSREEKMNQSDVDGLYDVYWSNGQGFNINGSEAGGYLKSMIEMRDGNNSENLKGTITSDLSTPTKVVLSSPSITEVSKMNMPSSGVITIGNHEYTYTGFTYDSTSKTYTFTLDASTPLVADPQNCKATIGETVNYKGIPYYMNQLNQLVRTYSNAFNNIHETGEDLNGDSGEYFFTGTDKVTGAEYDLDSASYYDVDTSTDGYYNLTAANFTINASIYDDPSKIAIAGSVTDGVEDKTVLDALIDLKNDTSLFYSGTVASFFESIVSDVAVGSERAKDMYDSQTDVVNLVVNQRLSVSGVDTDEEAMDLVKFQNAYNLSSKVISIMNEVYNKLINETGV